MIFVFYKVIKRLEVVIDLHRFAQRVKCKSFILTLKGMCKIVYKPNIGDNTRFPTLYTYVVFTSHYGMG